MPNYKSYGIQDKAYKILKEDYLKISSVLNELEIYHTIECDFIFLLQLTVTSGTSYTPFSHRSFF